jgi:hypothetical protein
MEAPSGIPRVGLATRAYIRDVRFRKRLEARQGKTVNTIDDFREYFAMCKFSDGHDSYCRTLNLKRITLVTTDGRRHDLRRLVVAGFNWWAHELFALSVIRKTPESLSSFSEHVDRSDERFKAPLAILARQGERLTRR